MWPKLLPPSLLSLKTACMPLILGTPKICTGGLEVEKSHQTCTGLCVCFCFCFETGSRVA